MAIYVIYRCGRAAAFVSIPNSQADIRVGATQARRRANYLYYLSAFFVTFTAYLAFYIQGLIRMPWAKLATMEVRVWPR